MNRSNTWRAEDEPELDEGQLDRVPGRRTLSMALPVRVQRAPAAGAAAAPPAPASGGAAPAADAMIVDDGAPAQAGQVERTTFLAQLREQVVSTASEALGPVASAVGCPYIENWFRTHAQTPAAELDRMARRYSGVTTPRSAADYIAPILTRLRGGIERWKAGENVASDAAAAGLGIGAVASPAAVSAANENGGAGAVQLKASGVGGAEPDSPAAVLGELGGGSALDAAHGGRLGAAMDDDFGDVRVHTDGAAMRKAAELGARAFTVGTHVAFAAGEYRPGTPEGDALLAHELAHVQQQRGGALDTTARKKVEIEGPEGALEQEADQVAAAAMTRLHGGDTAASARAKSSLRSTLSLKRCTNNTPAPTPAPSASSPAPAPTVPTTRPATDQHAGTAAPDATQQGAIMGELGIQPTTSGGAALPMWDGHSSRGATAPAARAALTTVLTSAMNAHLTSVRTSMLANQTASTSARPMTDVVPLGRAAKALADGRYSGFTAAAALPSDVATARTHQHMDATGSDQTLFNAWDRSDRSRAGLGINAEDLASWMAETIALRAPGVAPHNFTSHRSRAIDPAQEERVFLDAFVTSYAAAHRAELERYDQFGFAITDSETGRISMVPYVDPGGAPGAGGAPNTAQRRRRWHMFKTMVHEYIHTLEHPAFARAHGGNRVMMEGFCEMFTKELLNPDMGGAAGNATLRTAVEGGTYPLDAAAIPPYSPGEYASYMAHAEAVRSQAPGHEEAVRAAFFQGHVELIGLAPDGQPLPAMPAANAGTVEVPAGISGVGALETASGVPAADITASNAGVTIAPGARVRLAGCREHVVVSSRSRAGNSATENRANIAAQNGVSEADLVRANPDLALVPTPGRTDWDHLTAGQAILIPRH